MFSLNKLEATRLQWVPWRFNSRSRRRVDIETGSSSSVSCVPHNGSISESMSSGNSSHSQHKFSASLSGYDSNAQVPTSSISEPALGPNSNPEQFRLITLKNKSLESANLLNSVGIVSRPACDGDTSRDSRPASSRDSGSENGRMWLNSIKKSRTQAFQAACSSEIDNSAQNDDAIDNMVPLYLHAYFDTMYLFGTSPYKPKILRSDSDHHWGPWLINVWQTVFFCTITLWSFWESFHDAKYRILQFMAGDGLSYLVDFAFYFFGLLTKIIALYQLGLKNDDIGNMLENIEEYEREYGAQTKGKKSCWWKWTVLAFCTGTMIAAIGEALFEDGFEDWTAEDLILTKSHKLGEDLFLWKHQNMENKSVEIGLNYGRDLSFTSVSFGVIATACRFASDFQLGCFRDLVLLASFTILLFVNGFMKQVSTFKNDNMGDLDEIKDGNEKLWMQYEKLRTVVASINTVLDNLLLLLHVNNLFLYAFFISICIDTERQDTSMVDYAYSAYSIMKAELTYLLAKRVSKQNDAIRKWIRNWAYPTGIIGREGRFYDAVLALDELDKEPLGLGTGIFQIQDAFHYKFLGLVGSLVLFLADEKKNEL